MSMLEHRYLVDHGSGRMMVDLSSLLFDQNDLVDHHGVQPND